MSLPGLAITQQKLSEQQQSKANKKFNLESEARYIVTPGSKNVRQASKYILRSVPRVMQALAAQLTNYDDNMAIIEWQKFAPLRDWARLADFAQLSQHVFSALVPDIDFLAQLKVIREIGNVMAVGGAYGVVYVYQKRKFLPFNPQLMQRGSVYYFQVDLEYLSEYQTLLLLTLVAEQLFKRENVIFLGMEGDSSQFCALASLYSFLAGLNKNTTTTKTVTDILNIRRQLPINKNHSDTLNAFAASIALTESVFTERLHLEWRARIVDAAPFDSILVANCPSDLRLIVRTYDGVCGFIGKEFLFH